MRAMRVVGVLSVLISFAACGGGSTNSADPAPGAACPRADDSAVVDAGTLICRQEPDGLVWRLPQELASTPCETPGAMLGFDGGSLECRSENGVLVWQLVGGDRLPLPEGVTCGSSTNPVNPLALAGDNDNVRASLNAFPVECLWPRGLCEPTEEQSQFQWFRTDQSLAIDPWNPDRLIVGVERMGLFESRDRGDTWSPLSEDGVLHSLGTEDNGVCWTEVSRLTFDPTVPGRIYLHHGGGGTVDQGVWQARGAGLYVSNDDGATWDLLTTPDMCAYAAGFAISPDDPDTLYLGTVSSPQDVNGEKVVCVTTGLIYRSTDGGTTWSELPTGWGRRTGGSVVWVDPDDPTSMLLGVFQYPKDESNPAPEGPGLIGGWYRSSDTGQSWSQMAQADERTFVPSPLSAVSPDGQVILNPNDDLWISMDGGATWAKSDVPRTVPTFDPHGDGRRVYAILPAEVMDPRGTLDEFTVSDDGGLTWRSLGTLPPEMRANFYNEPPLYRRAIPSKIVVHPTNPNVIYVSGAGGTVARSEDGGATWKLLLTKDDLSPSNAVLR